MKNNGESFSVEPLTERDLLRASMQLSIAQRAIIAAGVASATFESVLDSLRQRAGKMLKHTFPPME